MDFYGFQWKNLVYCDRKWKYTIGRPVLG